MNPVDTVNGSGVVSGRGSNGFYQEITTTDNWQEVSFGFTSGSQSIINDAANAGDISYSTAGNLTPGGGKPIHGEVRQNQELLFEHRYTSKLFVKSTSSGLAATFRIYAW